MARESGSGQGGRLQAAAAAEHPWQAALTGLHRNVAQFGSNLAQLQHTVGNRLAWVGGPGGRRPAVPAAAVRPAPTASLSQAAASAGVPAAPVAASWSSSSGGPGSSGGSVSKEEIGRATWTFLHTLAAQYPRSPTRQQQRDARNLIDILTRMYPCGECAAHFRELVAASPPAVASRADFSRWMCEAHNTVNRRLGKPTFNCALAEARWAGVECEPDEEGRDACSLELGAARRRR